VATRIPFRQEVDPAIRRSAYPIHIRFGRVRGLGVENPRWLRRARYERGAAIVEFALAATILIPLVFGVIAMCMASYSYFFTSYAAREATRYAIVRGSSCPAYGRFGSACPAAPSDVQTYVQSLGFPGIDSSNISVTATWPTTGSTCTPASIPCNNPGNLVRVTVSYQLPLSIPFVSPQTLNLRSTSQMVIAD
jgi:Flp pilus assembly protein TadG